jgi:accessory colonization factor AcfC
MDMKIKLGAALLGMAAMVCSVGAWAEVRLYGPGGPHSALQAIAQDYEKHTGTRVQVTFGPQASWNERAKQDADILFGSSEQSALSIARDHAERFDVHAIEPLYLRPAVILVKKGNPKNITGLRDLATRDLGVVVPEGGGLSNTSGTGVWEDMVGRTRSIELVRKFRSNIVAFTPNSGAARQQFLQNPAVDAWITWQDWPITHPEIGEVVAIETDLVVYRDVNILVRKAASSDALKFAQYLKSPQARAIFEQHGWM